MACIDLAWEVGSLGVQQLRSLVQRQSKLRISRAIASVCQTGLVHGFGGQNISLWLPLVSTCAMFCDCVQNYTQNYPSADVCDRSLRHRIDTQIVCCRILQTYFGLLSVCTDPIPVCDMHTGMVLAPVLQTLRIMHATIGVVLWPRLRSRITV